MSEWSYGRYASQASQQRTCRVGRFISLEQAEREKCSLSRVGDEIGLEQFGATIMASPDLDRPSEDQRIVVRLSHVEVRPRTIRRVDSSTRVSLQMFNVGQAFRRNRYPIKLNYNGNMSLSYIKSCSIHSSSNQAIHLTATHGITIENNVIHHIM